MKQVEELLFLLLLLLHFDVSMLAELFLFGLLAFSGLKVFDVIDSNVMLCVRGIPTKRNLRIMTLNCRSINDKTSEFAATVNHIKPDIIC
jgi:hypothetical protein